jgi:hypothetical protein
MERCALLSSWSCCSKRATLGDPAEAENNRSVNPVHAEEVCLAGRAAWLTCGYCKQPALGADKKTAASQRASVFFLDALSCPGRRVQTR